MTDVRGVIQAIANQGPWFVEAADDVLARIKTDTSEDVMLYHDAVSVFGAAKTVYDLAKRLDDLYSTEEEDFGFLAGELNG